MLPYHEGELEVQARTGQFDEAVSNASIIRPVVPPPLARFLPTLGWILLGAADSQKAVWATALFGPPGFVHSVGDRVVRIDADFDPHDPLATLALPRDTGAGVDGVCHPLASPQVALLAIDPARRFRARINGRLDRHARGLTVATEQVYANCMKYIQRRSLSPAPLDTPAPAPETHRAATLSPDDVTLLTTIDTFFVATLAPGTDPGRGADVSHRGGHPGFLEPLGRDAVRFADYSGNSMFNTLGNLELNPSCGLLIPDFATGDLLHLTGHAAVDYDPEPLNNHPGAQRMVTLTISQIIRRVAASPLRSGPVEHSPFLPPRPVPGGTRSADVAAEPHQ